MKAYRFVSLRFPDGLSCEGARRYGGRWNTKGVAVLYCALSESLAMLELRVHAPHPYPRTRWKFAIEVPDDALTVVPVEQLPRGWDALPAAPASKRFGDHWVQQRTSLGLLVPSVVATEEKNLILNPSHPAFQEVRVISKQRVMLDKRLYSVPTKRARPLRGRLKNTSTTHLDEIEDAPMLGHGKLRRCQNCLPAGSVNERGFFRRRSPSDSRREPEKMTLTEVMCA